MYFALSDCYARVFKADTWAERQRAVGLAASQGCWEGFSRRQGSKLKKTMRPSVYSYYLLILNCIQKSTFTSPPYGRTDWRKADGRARHILQLRTGRPHNNFTQVRLSLGRLSINLTLLVQHQNVKFLNITWRKHAEAPWVRKVGRAGSCNFSTNTTNFWQNPDRQLQLFLSEKIVGVQNEF